MSFTAILPDSVSLTITALPIGEVDLVRFSYIERFKEDQIPLEMREQGMTVPKLVLNSLDALGRVLREDDGFQVRPVKGKRARVDGIEVFGTVTRKMMGDMMLGEFLSWGTIGDMRIRDMVIGSFATAAARASR